MTTREGLLFVAVAVAATLVAPSASYAAEAGESKVPSWIKNNAGWWAEGRIGDDVFIQGIQFLVREQIIDLPHAEGGVAPPNAGGIPGWVKNNAGWWAQGQIGDSDFINGIRYLVGAGIINVGAVPGDGGEGEGAAAGDRTLRSLEADLDACQEIAKAYKRLDCERAAKNAITVYEYKRAAPAVSAGPVDYYWMGIGSEGNGLEISPSGQAILTIRMLAENTGPDRVALNCTSPQICNYDVTDGGAEFKYSGMDFTNGQLVLNPGTSKEFNMLFGPDIGYGGTQFLYDPAKEYIFRISEDFGNAEIPLNLR